MDSAGNFLNTVRGHRERASTFQDELPELRFARAAYRKRLEQLIDLGEAAGVEVIFLTQPAMWRAGLSEKEKSLLWMGGPPLTHLEDGASYFSAEALAEGLARFNETLLEVCRARDVECVDVAEVIPRNPQFFYDDAHYTEKGADLLAATVADQLLEGGTLSNLAKP